MSRYTYLGSFTGLDECTLQVELEKTIMNSFWDSVGNWVMGPYCGSIQGNVPKLTDVLPKGTQGIIWYLGLNPRTEFALS